MRIINLLIGIILGFTLAEIMKKRYIVHGPRSRDIKNKIFYDQGVFYRLHPVAISRNIT